MKKIIAMVLALMMMFAMTAAMASEVSFENEDDQTIETFDEFSFTKGYTTEGVSPAVQFDFTATYDSYVGDSDETIANEKAPTVTIESAAYESSAYAGEAGNKTLAITVSSLDEVPLGKYIYNITESENGGLKAGVSMGINDETAYQLAITVIVDTNNAKHFVGALHKITTETVDEEEKEVDIKVDNIPNTFEAHSLTITKEVTGNLGDKSKKFTFTITFEKGEDLAADVVFDTTSLVPTVMNGSTDITSTAVKTTNTDTANKIIYTVELAHGDSITVANIPTGIKYTVREESENYTSNKTEDTITGTITDDVSDTFVNDLRTTVDTGISLETLPYVILIGLAVIGAALMIIRRRRHNED